MKARTKLECPDDGASLTLQKHAKGAFHFCPTCRGVWLDGGFLDPAFHGQGSPAIRQPVAGSLPRSRPQQRLCACCRRPGPVLVERRARCLGGDGCSRLHPGKCRKPSRHYIVRSHNILSHSLDPHGRGMVREDLVNGPAAYCASKQQRPGLQAFGPTSSSSRPISVQVRLHQ